MAIANNVLIISPPLFLGEINEEKKVFTGFRCSRCSGNGWTWGEVDGEPEHIPCKFCNATGEIVAVVTVEWKGVKTHQLEINE